jgi:hypothetical protein
MAEDLIRYDVLVQEALRGVVRKVVTEAAKAGLPGEHHFFIAFDTTAPGVRISTRIKEKYPEEMTVVLQHQFWELTVTDSAFEVGLSFDGIAEKLHIPYTAIKGFFDPSVQFGLQFEPQPAKKGDIEAVYTDADSDNLAQAVNTLEAVEAQTLPDSANTDRSNTGQSNTGQSNTPAPKPADGDGVEPGADVVSLDSFRKKS